MATLYAAALVALCVALNIGNSASDKISKNSNAPTMCPSVPTSYKVQEASSNYGTRIGGGVAAKKSPEEELLESGTIKWMYMPDDHGDVKPAILSDPPKSFVGRGAVIGEVSFLIYTRENRTNPEKVVMSSLSPPKINTFKPNRDTVVLIHGYRDTPETSIMYPLLKDGKYCKAEILSNGLWSVYIARKPRQRLQAYLDTGDYNVIAVDWSLIANTIWYQTALRGTRTAGEHLAKLLDHLVKSSGAQLNNTHIVGFSLGAHAAGAAGAHVRSGKIGWITGLDPAGVSLDENPEYRLQSKHAEFVDVLHTSGGFLGYASPIGHRDFFSNGGRWPQPGCYIDYSCVCSHRRAYYFYAEAIRKNNFKAHKCSTKEAMPSSCSGPAVAYLGDRSCKGAPDCSGSFYLKTNEVYPYGGGK